jgi:DNA-binding NarL/FixJ family response regulator
VLLDVSMPELNGIEACHLIKKNNRAVKVAALTMHTTSEFVRGMFSAGASGYILKESLSEDLPRALRMIAQGKTYVDPAIASIAVSPGVSQSTSAPGTMQAFGLSCREREVLQLIAEGKSTREIAHLLFISTKTVDSHRRQIMQKLELDSIAKLIKFAIQQGLTTLE